jgi:hypothetical protein
VLFKSATLKVIAWVRALATVMLYMLLTSPVAFSVYEMVDSGTTSDQKKEPNDNWSVRTCDPYVPNAVIAPHNVEKSRVLASYDHGYFRSFLM